MACHTSTYGCVWLNGVGQNRETDEEHDEDCVEERCQLARVKCDRDMGGGREALVWNYLDPRKAGHILKTIFQHFYYPVFRIHRFLWCVMFYIE